MNRDCADFREKFDRWSLESTATYLQYPGNKYLFNIEDSTIIKRLRILLLNQEHFTTNLKWFYTLKLCIVEKFLKYTLNQ